jgi:PmbA protein
MNKINTLEKALAVAAASQQEPLKPDYWQTLAVDILREAQMLGASAAEVEVSVGKGFSVASRLGEVETVEYNQGKNIDINVYFGKRSGTASIADTRWESIQTAVQAACHIARFTEEDSCAGLADRSLLAFNYPQLEMAFPWNITVEQAIEMACTCEKESLALDKRIVNSEGVTIATNEGWYLYANSEQFMGHYAGTSHDISSVLVAKENTEMQRDYCYTSARDPQLLLPLSRLAKEAVDKTIRRLGARRLSTRKAPVIFIAEEARRLLGTFASAIQGGNLFRKSSFLLNQLGKPIFPAFINIYERPHLAKAMGSAPFDDDGVATRDNVFVEDGILQNYSLGVYSARQLGMHTTGNAGGMHNLMISTGKYDLRGLLQAMGTGLLVTEVMGPGVNVVTGDYSRGASGFWVEQGEIQYPVQEITIAGHLQEMYAHILEVGKDVDTRGNIQTGSLWLEEMMIAGA